MAVQLISELEISKNSDNDARGDSCDSLFHNAQKLQIEHECLKECHPLTNRKGRNFASLPLTNLLYLEV